MTTLLEEMPDLIDPSSSESETASKESGDYSESDDDVTAEDLNLFENDMLTIAGLKTSLSGSECMSTTSSNFVEPLNSDDTLPREETGAQRAP